MDMYTSKRLVGCQAAIASKLGSHNGSGYIRESQGGCQAAIASKLAPTFWIWVHPREPGRLSGRLRWQATLLLNMRRLIRQLAANRSARWISAMKRSAGSGCPSR